MQFLLNPEQWGLTASSIVFLVSAVCIVVAGWRLAKNSDRLADRTGLGEAVAGAVLMGGATSISGMATSVAAAWDGLPQLAAANALGGIPAQTAFLAIADAFYRRANLEHAAASAANMMQASLLVTLLAIILTAMLSPDLTFLAVHPASLLLVITYIYGIQMVHAARTESMWEPGDTKETRRDEPAEAPAEESLTRLWLTFAGLVVVLLASGWMLEKSAAQIAEKARLSQSLVGGLFTAVTTSLPELVTSIAAVRRGALTLAVGGIIGGNAFDTLILVCSDIAHRGGSIYHAATQSQMLMVALTIVMTGVLIMGLIRRETRGIWNIGLESFVILLLYAAVVLSLMFA